MKKMRPVCGTVLDAGFVQFDHHFSPNDKAVHSNFCKFRTRRRVLRNKNCQELRGPKKGGDLPRLQGGQAPYPPSISNVERQDNSIST